MNEILEQWKANKGLGIVNIVNSNNAISLIAELLKKCYSANNNYKTLIIVKDYAYRTNVIGKISADNSIKEAVDKKLIRVYTNYYIEQQITVNYALDILIIANIGFVNQGNWYKIKEAKFKFFIDDNSSINNDTRKRVYEMVPVIVTKEIVENNSTTPVEERILPIHLDDATEATLSRVSEYINNSFAIFGNIDNLQYAISGNPQLNISAIDYCSRIASENGWNDRLDMSIELNRKIDEIYNPVSLQERASNTYKLIKQRINVCADYNGKINAIIEAIQNDNLKNILIVCKSCEFASTVANEINAAFNKEICKPYHSKLNTTFIKDDNGEYILYKSGNFKGTKKLFGAQAQMSFIERDYNRGDINIIVANSAVNKALSVAIECVFIVSPMCLTIENYLYRLSSCQFSRPLKLYTLFCKNTIEEKALNNREIDKNYHKILNYDFSANNVKNNDIIIVD
jgi:hypothetical protein